MNRSFSKIRHIQEANSKIEKRFLNEQGALDAFNPYKGLADKVYGQNQQGFLDPWMTQFKSQIENIKQTAQNAAAGKNQKATTPPASQSNVELVKKIQEKLNQKFNANLTADGKWGPQTQAAFEKAVESLKSAPAAAAPAAATPAPATAAAPAAATPAPATAAAPAAATPAPATAAAPAAAQKTPQQIRQQARYDAGVARQARRNERRMARMQGGGQQDTATP